MKRTTIRAKQKTFNMNGWKSTIYAVSPEIAHILFFFPTKSSCWNKRGKFGRKMIESERGKWKPPLWPLKSCLQNAHSSEVEGGEKLKQGRKQTKQGWRWGRSRERETKAPGRAAVGRAGPDASWQKRQALSTPESFSVLFPSAAETF